MLIADTNLLLLLLLLVVVPTNSFLYNLFMENTTILFFSKLGMYNVRPADPQNSSSPIARLPTVAPHCSSTTRSYDPHREW